ncbi:hypothetical protein K3495_g6833 [Podosphaera aphanis]|nr:hypothetical protein K3495_g6833 [Podosphaera aphanis]
MKQHTIKNSFSKPRICPISFKKALRARSRYDGKTRKNNEEMRRQEEAGLDELELPLETQHIHQRPKTHYKAAMYMKEICTRATLDPPSPAAYREALLETHELLIRADTQADQIKNLEAIIIADCSRKIATRKSVHKGRGINFGQWKAKIDERNRRGADEALERIGIDNRKAKKEYTKNLGGIPTNPLIISGFREPDKDESCRTPEEVSSLLPPPDLHQTLDQLIENRNTR